MRICPVCEGLTSSDVVRCGTCDVPLVRTSEVAWVQREGEEHGGSPWIGVVLGGKYRITGVLGKGGMGTVFRAVHELSLSTVAVKVLHPRFARHARFKETLLEEARKASLLRSDHAARVVDVGETPEGSVFVAMELARGETLDVWLARGDRLPHWVVTELLVQLCDALEDASSHGIVHRDLSPRNIIIEAREDGFRAKVLDFGIAIARDPRGVVQGEVASAWVHPPYTAPEILLEEDHDARADLFSVGVIAVECLSGTPPFDLGPGASVDDRIRAVLEDAPDSLGARAAPRGLRRLLDRLLAKDPARRPASARLVRDALEGLRRPKKPWFQVAAVFAFIAGSTALLTGIATSRIETPFLQSGSGTALALGQRRIPGDQTQFLPIEKIENVAFVARGLRADNLVVRGYDGEEQVFEYELSGRLSDSLLELDASRDLAWRAILDTCVKRERPIDLDFQERTTQRVIAFARVFVDARAPTLDVEPLPGRLAIATRFRARVQDASPQVEASFELVRDGRVLASLEATPDATKALDLPIGRLLVPKPGVELDEQENGTLICRIVDAAGRVTEWTKSFERVDLRIPQLDKLEAADGNSPVAVDAGLARLTLGLDQPEAAPSKLHVRGVADGRATDRTLRESEFSAYGNTIRFTWEVASPPAPQIEFSVELEDACGNRSAPLTRSLRFVDLELDARFEIRNPERPILDRRAQLSAKPDGAEPWFLRVAAGAPIELTYSCNVSWEPRPTADGASAVVVSQRMPGRCLIAIPALTARSRLSLRVRHVRADAAELEPLRTATLLEVVALPVEPTVIVAPRLVSGVFATELAAESLLVIQDDKVRVKVDLDPPASPDAGLRGRLWYEQGGRWFAAAPKLLTLENAVEFARLQAPLLDGRNRVALQLEDALGRRPKESDSARIIDLGDARGILVADYYYAAELSEGASVAVEFERPVVLTLRDEAPLPSGSATTLFSGQRSFPGALSVAPDGTRSHRFSLPWEFVRELCAWASIARESFASAPPRTEEFVVRTRARDRRVRVRFEPTRSLLRGLTLKSIGVRTESIRDMGFAPLLAPVSGAEVRLGPPAGREVRGSVRIEPPVAVSGLRDVFIGEREVSRADYLAFVNDIVGRVDREELELAALVHREDPMGAERFTRQGLMPDLSLFGERSLSDVVAAAPERPMTGVDYYQASAFCRWLGLVALGDAEMFRLPFGAELEWAALGDVIGGDTVHGISTARLPAVEDWRREFAQYRERVRLGTHCDPRRWPASVAECRRLGDVAVAWDGASIYGLEFGVCEWVEDLPIVGADPTYRLLVEIHDRHVDYAKRRRIDLELRPPRARVLDTGQVRGLCWGEPESSGRDPLADIIDIRGFGLAEGILGVKRIRYLRRDARGLRSSEKAPLVRVTGFRVVGGDDFIRRLRERLR